MNHCEARTVVELVDERAATHASRGYTFLGDGVSVSEAMTYPELAVAAKRIAVGIRAAGTAPGSRALLLYPSGLEFVRAFFGCLFAGIIPVPVPAPNPARLARTLPRLRTIAEDAQIHLVLTSSDMKGAAAAMLPLAPELAAQQWIATDSTEADAGHWTPPTITGADAALLQYTSGSTGSPRGVTITHDNLLHNMHRMRRLVFSNQPHEVMVTWLPVYHDMGLIGGMLTPLLDGADCVMMSPIQFLQDPVKWLTAVTTHRGTTTGAPNFAYDLCVRKVADAQLEKLDLSTLRVAYCGAEPVRIATMERFATRFAPAGFSIDKLRPAYGLAEATLVVSGALEEGPRHWPLSSDALLQRRVELDPSSPYSVMSCGHPLDDIEVAIVDDENLRCGGDRVGEVWVRSASVSVGYWGKPAETEHTFGARLSDGTGPFLRTGDLGFIAPDGGLCIVGRAKDVIIVRGKNYYPHDIEASVEDASPCLRRGGSAAVSMNHGDEEAVMIVAEIDPKVEPSSWDDVVAAIRATIGTEHEVTVAAVHLLAAGQLPKTPSGKVQRAETKRRVEAGDFEQVHAWRATVRALTGRPQYLPIDAASERPSKEEIATFMRGWLREHLDRDAATDASFASLGLDSLELVRLIDALRAHLKQPALSASAAMNFPSIEALAHHLSDRHEEAPSELEAPALGRRGADTAYVTSYWQDTVLAWESRRPPTSTWSETFRVRLRGPLVERKLEEAIRRVVERQDALRQILRRDGAPGTLCSVLDIWLEHTDVAGRSEAEIEELYREVTNAPFALDGDPLVRFRLLRRSATDSTLLISWHQLVHEGTGGADIAQEVLETYAALIEKRAPDLPELPVRYGDFAAWERSYFQGAGRPEVVAMQKRIEGAPILPLPTDRPRSDSTGLRGQCGALWGLSSDQTARLLKLCQASNVTLFTGIVAMSGMLLSNWAQTGEVSLLCPTSTRSQRELRSLLGRFGAWTPFRLACGTDPTLAELFAQVSTQSALARMPVPMSLVFGTPSVLDHPLSRAIVNTPDLDSGARNVPLRAADLDVTVEPMFKPLTPRNELTIIAARRGGELVGRVTGYAELYDTATLESRASDLVDILTTADADTRVSAFAKR